MVAGEHRAAATPTRSSAPGCAPLAEEVRRRRSRPPRARGSTTPPRATGARSSARAQARVAERRCPGVQASPGGRTGPSQPRSPGPSPFTLWSVIPEMGAKRASPASAETVSGPATSSGSRVAESAGRRWKDGTLPPMKPKGTSGTAGWPGGLAWPSVPICSVVGEVPLEQQVGEGVAGGERRPEVGRVALEHVADEVLGPGRVAHQEGLGVHEALRRRAGVAPQHESRCAAPLSGFQR